MDCALAFQFVFGRLHNDVSNKNNLLLEVAVNVEGQAGKKTFASGLHPIMLLACVLDFI